jgi:hypothetical protein
LTMASRPKVLAVKSLHLPSRAWLGVASTRGQGVRRL